MLIHDRTPQPFRAAGHDSGASLEAPQPTPGRPRRLGGGGGGGRARTAQTEHREDGRKPQH